MEWLDGQMNDVYQAIRVVLRPERFAQVKADQIAWLKKLEASKSVDQKCQMMVARIQELRDAVW